MAHSTRLVQGEKDPVKVTAAFNQLAQKFDSLAITSAIFGSRSMTASSGNVSYTGVGFTPKKVLFFGIGGNGVNSFSIGIDNAVSPRAYMVAQSAAWFTTGGDSIYFANPTQTDTQIAKVISFDTDGFTLAWTASGSPTGTAFFSALCFSA